MAKQYDDDVREFVQQQQGVFLVASADPLFNRNLRGTLIRHLSVKDECVSNVFSSESLQKEIKLLKPKRHRILVFIERDLSGRPTAELIRYLKTEHPDILIVVLTTEVEREKLILLHELGADNVITKPISPDTLIEKIAFTVKPRGQIGELIDVGRQLLDEERNEEAIAAAEKVLALKPGSPAGLLLKGDGLLALGRRDEALDVYQQAQREAKLYLEPLKKIALLHHQAGNVKEELKYLERLDKLSPLNIDRKVEIGSGYIKIGDVDKARENFDQAVKMATKEAMNSLTRISQTIAAKCLEAAPELSEQYLRQTLNSKKGLLDKTDIETFNRLGITLRRQGKWEEAVAEYRKALKISPNDAGLFYNIAMAFFEGKKTLEAYQYLDKALNLNPELWRAGEAVSVNIALVMRRAGKRDQAADFAQRALSLAPDYEKAKNLLRDLAVN